MRAPAHRTLHIGAIGEDVRRFQVGLNARARARGMALVAVDGVYGKVTARAYHDVGAALGLLRSTLLKGATMGAQRVIRSGRRTPAMLVRAKARQLAAKRQPLRLKAFAEAKRFLALRVREVGGNNIGADVVDIIKINHGVPGESWCGDFVAACYLLAGSKLVQRMWASTIWLAANLLAVAAPLRGHVVVYSFGTGGPKHTGLFDEWEIPGVTFWAIEGNTTLTSRASDVGGGEGVELRLRHVDDVARTPLGRRAFLRVAA